MKQEIRNKVVGSLLTILEKAGFKLIGEGIGLNLFSGTIRQRREIAKKLIVSFNEVQLFVSINEKLKWLRLDVTNAPDCLVVDFSVNEHLHDAVKEFQDKWRGWDSEADVVKDYEKRFRKISKAFRTAVPDIALIHSQIPKHLRE